MFYVSTSGGSHLTEQVNWHDSLEDPNLSESLSEFLASRL